MLGLLVVVCGLGHDGEGCGLTIIIFSFYGFVLFERA